MAAEAYAEACLSSTISIATGFLGITIGNIENGVIVPFPAPDQKVSRQKRRHRRDRLLEYDEREAA